MLTRATRKPRFCATIAGSRGVLSSTAIAWFAARMISLPTLERAGVRSGTTEFQGQGFSEAVAFPYHMAGKLINVKYRAIPRKEFKQTIGGQQRLWLLDEALKYDTIYLVEGEIDALSLIEAGLTGVVSLPGGAGSAVPEVLEPLRNACKLVLALDSDIPGVQARNNIIAFLGPARCYLADFGGLA